MIGDQTTTGGGEDQPQQLGKRLGRTVLYTLKAV